jgi:leucyl aminopeptidase
MSSRTSGAPPTVAISFSAEPIDQVSVDALVVGVPEQGEPLSEPAFALDAALGGNLRNWLAEARFTGKLAGTAVVQTLGGLPAKRLVAVGLPNQGLTAEDIRRAYGAAAMAARSAGAVSVAVVPPSGLADQTAAYRAAVEGLLLALYDFRAYRSDTDDANTVEQWTFLAEQDDDAREGLRQGFAVAAGVYLARDLTYEPGNVLYPETLTAVARSLATDVELDFKEFDEAQLAEMGAGALVAVGQGSSRPPRLFHMTYTPAKPSVAAVAVVGKGITFDTGGFSLKTVDGIVSMKQDMAGSAAVLGVMRAIAELDLPITVHGIVAAAENMASDTAYRPDDVLRAMNGKTIEITSTDAEGRLVLADALVYTARQGVEEMIDIATLTGAKMVALGAESVAVYCNDDAMAAGLLEAAGETGEIFWRMPLWDHLKPKLKSETADLKNTGGRDGGSITGALFIGEFSEGKKWAHLDIAGAAWSSSATGYTPKGATGVTVRALIAYLEAKARQEPES